MYHLHMYSLVLLVYLGFVSCIHVFVCQDCEVLETETKRFEDLEFQQLERESRQDEEKETHTQQLLREIADYQRSTVSRKVKVWSCIFCIIFYIIFAHFKVYGETNPILSST